MDRAQLEKRKAELQQEVQKARIEMQRLTQAAARIDGAIILIDELLAEPDPEPEPEPEAQPAEKITVSGGGVGQVINNTGSGTGKVVKG